MDKRSLLLGLGVGIIVGALLMQLFIMGENSTNQLKEIDNTINGVDLPLTSTPKPEAVEVPNNVESTPTEPPVEPTVEATPTPVSAQPNSDVKTGEYSDNEQSPVSVLLRVYSGATISETAKVLVANGILSSEQEFVRYAKSKNKVIRAGFFIIQNPSTNEEILNILTSIPLTEEEATQLVTSEGYNTIYSPQR